MREIDSILFSKEFVKSFTVITGEDYRPFDTIIIYSLN